jgi:hypothetical protein
MSPYQIPQLLAKSKCEGKKKGRKIMNLEYNLLMQVLKRFTKEFHGPVKQTMY